MTIDQEAYPRSALHRPFQTAPLAAIDVYLRAGILALSYQEHPQLTLRQRFRFAASTPLEIVDDIGAGAGAWPIISIEHIIVSQEVLPFVEIGRSKLPPSLWFAPNDAVLFYLRTVVLTWTYETWPLNQFPEFTLGRRLAFADHAPIEVMHDPELIGARERDRADWTKKDHGDHVAQQFRLLKDIFAHNRKLQRRFEREQLSLIR